MTEATNPCTACGTCCRQKAPLTLYDVHRLAVATGRPPQVVFEEAVGPVAPLRQNAFTIQRTSGDCCVYHDRESKLCTIHEAKPRVCYLFPCPKLGMFDRERWVELFKAVTTQELFWEHKLAEEVTAEYIQRHGTTWNEHSFLHLVAEVERRLQEKLAELCGEVEEAQ